MVEWLIGYWILGTGYWVLGTGLIDIQWKYNGYSIDIFLTDNALAQSVHWILDVGYWLLDARCQMLDTGYWVLGAERCNPEPRAKKPEPRTKCQEPRDKKHWNSDTIK